MLTRTESVFLEIVRRVVIGTAFLAISVCVIALAFAAYARYAPEPKFAMADHFAELREATRAANLIKTVFPKNSRVAQTADEDFPLPSNYRLEPDALVTEPKVSAILESIWDVSFSSEDTYSSLLFGDRSAEFSWSKSIDSADAKNENNVNVLWQSLYVSYINQLAVGTAQLRALKKSGKFDSEFKRLLEPDSSDSSGAPYLIYWFFDTLDQRLADLATEFDEKVQAREVLRMSQYPALYVAGAAFTYFLIVMFLFLGVSVEMHIRSIATSVAPRNVD